MKQSEYSQANIQAMHPKRIQEAADRYPSPPGIKHTFGTAGFRAK